ncbi:MAG: shikimate dehydrogenase [Oscillospiraceae bacterium]|nr:shikimate dehydrogenase [Oscillospiraceae bacterium]
MDKQITGKTQTLALIGSPVGHSGSPAMYNYCFEKLGFDCVYVAFDVPLEKLNDAMTGIKALNFRGINITMPCKSAILDYMDEISPAAKLMGACNTALNENGRWIGHNTDGIGYVESLKAEGVDIAGKRITVMGAGGAGTAIAVQCALSGAKQISIFNLRDDFYKRAEQTAANICRELCDCSVRVHDLADERLLLDSVMNSDILANTTRAGMAPDLDRMPISSTEVLRKGLVVTDTIYNPRETRLLREAKAAGCITVGGTGMLIYQGAAAFKLYTGDDMPVGEIRERFFS